MNGMPEQEKLYRNLKDAGCDEAFIKRYLQLQKEGGRQQQYQLLSMHRMSLLNQVHVSQQMIDCLDFLIYAMKKQQI